MAKVKVSGLTNYNDALNATNLGADFLSFSFIKESPKKVSEKLFLDITSKLPPFINCVAVFGRNKQKDILRIIKKYSIKNVQFNEEISSEICKSIKETQNIKIFKYFKINQESDILALASYKDIADYFVLSVDCINGQSSKDSYDIVLKADRLKSPYICRCRRNDST
ncbi:MAG: hypothetical protein LBS29_00175 [Endomicrobium sp.]|jgi:phosphoribosylanthranilate isomerase|nr:hypothetical protein [Endomicrobium sp.]